MRERDRAIGALHEILSKPGNGALATNMGLTPALLRLDPMFDPLRNNLRFQKLLAQSRGDFGMLPELTILDQ